MSPHSQSDFIEHGYEPRQSPGSGLRRLALLLPLVAAVPISFAVLSQRNADNNENPEVSPPPAEQLTPVAGLPQNKDDAKEPAAQADKGKVTPKPKGGGKTETVDPAELAKVLNGEDTETKDKAKEGEKPDAKPAAADKDKDPKEVAAKPDQDKADAKNDKPKVETKVADAKKPEHKPAPKPEAKPAAPKRPSTHIVQPGDTLYNIGKRYSIPAEAVARKNGITLDDHIRPGQSLKVPTVDESKRLMAQRSTPPSNTKTSSNTRSQSPPPGPVPYPLTPTSGLAQQKPRTSTQIRTQPTQQPKATTTSSRPAIGVAPRHRTAKPRPVNQQPAQPTQWAHANGTFVPAGAQPQPQQKPNTQPKIVAPTGVLRPVSGGMVHSTRSINYRVQPNDTLPSIAAGHSTTVGVISQVNGGLSSVRNGQTVIVPVDGILIPTPQPRGR